MSITLLAEISRYYGANPGYVLAGGGNTSFKDRDTLYIKGSGMSLADARPEDFVKMNRKALAGIWEKKYPDRDAEREREVLSDMMAARLPGEERKRPSVETLLHDMLPFAFVVHTHPALVNGLTCSRRGEGAMTEIFQDEAVWIPSTNPGYILAQRVKDAMDTYRAKHGKNAAIVFLQNHGIFVGADSTDDVKALYNNIMTKISAKINRRPDFSGEDRVLYDTAVPNAPSAQTGLTLAELGGGNAVFFCNREIAALVKDRSSFAPVSSAFTPDHIVYAGSDPLFIEESFTGKTALEEVWKKHVEKTGRKPKIAAVQNLGVFGIGASKKTSAVAVELFKDTVKVALYAESFGGPRFMTAEDINFINNWEAERFRSSVSAH